MDGYGLKAITWGGSQFVAVGSIEGWGNLSGLVLASRDGVTWTQRPKPSKRGELRDVAWSGARCVAVGALRKGWFADHISVLVVTSP